MSRPSVLDSGCQQIDPAKAKGLGDDGVWAASPMAYLLLRDAWRLASALLNSRLRNGDNEMTRVFRRAIIAGLAVAASCAHNEEAQQPITLADSPPAAESSPSSTADSAASSADTDNGWPRTLSSGSDQITIYQPQIESWDRNALAARAAVSVQTAASSQPVYGVVWFSARTEVDKENRVVTLQDVQLTKTNFPSEPDRNDQYSHAIRQQISKGIQTIALDRLQASLAVTRAEEKQATVAVKNTTPRIIYSATPALLILIDGQPTLRKVDGTSLLRIINTRSLILLDSANGRYYLFLANRWMQARAVTGPWTAAQNTPSSLETAKQAAVKAKLVDLLDDPDSPVVAELQKGVVPTLYVRTTPASLIQTDGQPQFQPVASTQLLEVTNSSDQIFLNSADQRYYVLLSGRWYRSASLQKGPWSFVSAKQLPTGFSQIPENHPKGAVLASVAGTAQAQEATIANQIPQTATVDRKQAKLTVMYDGAPQFKPVCQTAGLTYAVNSATPVIRTGPTTYFAVDSGIWFTATSPNGPWTVATFVPQEVYSIPACSPIYNVTHVYVYGATPEVVYTGYTPGYLGSFASTDGVVVFGTGYVYPPWVGTVWVGAPVTFGFDVGWTLGFGWGFGGFAFGVWGGPLFHPWWGPYGWGWGHRDIWVHNIHYDNIYHEAWHRDVVRDHWDRHGFANRGRFPGDRRGGNSVFAGRDGHAYRNSGNGGWQRFGNGGWHPAPGAGSAGGRVQPGFHGPGGGASQPIAHAPANELSHESQARDIGASHYGAFRAGGGAAGGGFHGGGVGGGGVGGGGFHGGGFGGGGFHGGGFGGGGGFHGGGGGGRR
jgi:hypothetical protein